MSWIVLAATPLDKFAEWVEKESEKIAAAREAYQTPGASATEIRELIEKAKPAFATFEFLKEKGKHGEGTGGTIGPLRVDWSAVEAKVADLGLEGADARRALEGFRAWSDEVLPEDRPPVLHQGIPGTGRGSPEIVQHEVVEAEPGDIPAEKPSSGGDERRRKRDEKRQQLMDTMHQRYRDVRKEEPHPSEEYQEHAERMKKRLERPEEEGSETEVPTDPAELARLEEERATRSRKPGPEDEVEVGASVLPVDQRDPASQAPGDTQLGHIVEDVVDKVGKPKKVTVKIKVSR